MLTLLLQTAPLLLHMLSLVAVRPFAKIVFVCFMR